MSVLQDLTREEQCFQYIDSRLSKGRAAHCRRTFQKALELNEYYGVGLDRRSLALVTLLHDCAREATAQELEDLLPPEVYNSVPGGSANVGLLHGHAGALLVENELGIKDREVLDAIAYHVTGRDEPSALLTLQLVSDLLEDGRPFREHVPKPFEYENIYGLSAAVMACKLSQCLASTDLLLNDAVQAYNWYVRRAV